MTDKFRSTMYSSKMNEFNSTGVFSSLNKTGYGAGFSSGSSFYPQGIF